MKQKLASAKGADRMRQRSRWRDGAPAEPPIRPKALFRLVDLRR
jgi:hypothetical protein